MADKIQRRPGERIRWIDQYIDGGFGKRRTYIKDATPVRTDGVEPCENCGDNRWKTIIKTASWRCWNCKTVRKMPWADAVASVRAAAANVNKFAPGTIFFKPGYTPDPIQPL